MQESNEIFPTTQPNREKNTSSEDIIQSKEAPHQMLIEKLYTQAEEYILQETAQKEKIIKERTHFVEPPPVITMKDLLEKEKKHQSTFTFIQKTHHTFAKYMLKKSLSYDARNKNIDDETLEKIICFKQQIKKTLDIKNYDLYQLFKDGKNDPVEVIERIKQCGFKIDKTTYETIYSLHFLIHRIPHVTDILKRLTHEGIFKDIFEKRFGLNRLGTVGTFVDILEKLQIDADEVMKNLGSIAKDQDALKLFGVIDVYTKNSYENGLGRMGLRRTLTNVVHIQKAGMVSDVLKLVLEAGKLNVPLHTIGISHIPHENFSDELKTSTKKSPLVIQTLRENPDRAEFARKTSLLLGSSVPSHEPYLKMELQLYTDLLPKQKEIIALSYALRECFGLDSGYGNLDIKNINELYKENNSEEIWKGIDFLLKVKELYHDFYQYPKDHMYFSRPYLKNIVKASKTLADDPSIFSFLKEIIPYGFTLDDKKDFYVLENLTVDKPQQTSILSAVQSIKKSFPIFIFKPCYQINKGFIINPYFILFNQLGDEKTIMQTLYKKEKAGTPVPQEFINQLLLYKKNLDSFSKHDQSAHIDQQTYDNFNKNLRRLNTELFDPEGKLKEYQNFYTHKNIFVSLPQSPEKFQFILDLPQKAPLLLHKDNQSIASYVLDNWNTFVTDESDLLFLNTLIAQHGKPAEQLIKDYARCLEEKVITTHDKDIVREFTDQFRVLSPAIIKKYKEAKQSGTEKIFLASLRSISEKLTGSSPLTQKEQSFPYTIDLIKAVYAINSGQWSSYESNETCADRSSDLASFKIRPRYTIDLLSQSEIQLKEGQKIDQEAIENTKNKVLNLSHEAQEFNYDVNKMQEKLNEEIDNYLKKIETSDVLQNITVADMSSIEEKLFLICLDSIYGNNPNNLESTKSFLLQYECAYFEDIRDYISGTSDRVKQANNQDYALLCELHTFFSDRIKETNKRIIEKGFANQIIAEKLPDIFKDISRTLQNDTQSQQMNQLQIDKLGLNDAFLRQISKVFKGKYTPEQLKTLIKKYENITKGLSSGKTISTKNKTRAFYGQLKSQRDKTLKAVELSTGHSLDPSTLHLEEIDVQKFTQTEAHIEEGEYDENQFASYTAQRIADFFTQERTVIETELDKFISISGHKQKILHGYISKNKETANARMVGGVCVAGDNPIKGKDNMWDMPNYFQLVLQDPETYRCQGVVLLHHFEENGQKILTASFNPSSTYLYSVDESATFDGLLKTLVEFSQDNHFDRILISKNPTIRTNRTGGIFEKRMGKIIKQVNREYEFSESKQFSYNPLYFMQENQMYKKMDVVWEKNIKSS